ncbi:hypothetical protein [Aurantimonas sp. A3-2-R12]|uniref:hypothetical protein n=1 Tax=Aurantimonas sp. A3-2-R12 TaxID=3114362 RepID=UPI002E18F1B0|nr:hypothetical protein [Aurantimonas sp. A3-2-R12]
MHQISLEAPDLERAQLAISDIIEALDRFGAPAGVLTTMFRTSADQMHVFSPEEIAAYGINRIREPSGSPDAAALGNSLATRGGNEQSRPQDLLFYQERTETLPGTQESGDVVWSVVNESPAEGQPSEPAIRAEAQIPDENLEMIMTIRRNADSTLPASHVIELLFTTPENFSGGSVANVQRLALKPTEQARGEPLIGVAGKVSDGFFIIALNNLDQAMQDNMALLQNEQWIDIPITYASGRRALISLDKGASGDEAFNEAFRIWNRQRLE